MADVLHTSDWSGWMKAWVDTSARYLLSIIV